MVRCERAALIIFIGYIQNRVYEKCQLSENKLQCVLEELEKLKRDIEAKAISEIELEIYG